MKEMIARVTQIKQQLLSSSLLPSVRCAEAKEAGVRTNDAVKMGH